VLAALIWTLVGSGLLIAGSRMAGIQAILAGLVLGWLKGRYILAGMARANANRIITGPERAPILAAYSLSSWGIGGFFMVLGMVLRRSGLSPGLLGFIYVSAGFGLGFASCHVWRAWHRFTSQVTEP
jgi:hypothetical protein